MTFVKTAVATAAAATDSSAAECALTADPDAVIDPSAFSPVTARFRLPPLVTAVLRRKPVAWGYGQYSEFVFMRTHGRDGETWADVCVRVVEGTFSLLKDRIEQTGGTWDDEAMTDLAVRMLFAKHAFRWGPPGRGEFAIGHDHVYGVGSTPDVGLGGHELLVTRDRGVLPLERLIGRPVVVLSDRGWVDAVVVPVGLGLASRVTLAPAAAARGGWRAAKSNHRVTLVAGVDQPLRLVDGSETSEVDVDDTVSGLRNRLTDREGEAYADGFRHGLVFADGAKVYDHTTSDLRLFQLRLCGAKGRYVDLFDRVTYPASSAGDATVRITTATDLKAVPAPGSDPDYVAGFVAGWLAGDGSPNGSRVVLSSQNADAFAWLRTHAALAGYQVTGANWDSTTQTNFGRRKAPLQRMSLTQAEIAWRVVAVDDLPHEERLYGIVAPGASTIALAGGVAVAPLGDGGLILPN